MVRVALLALTLLGAPDAGVPAADPFAGLSQLVGTWEARTASGKSTRSTFRRASAESVLVETDGAGSTRETLTLYHRDLDRVLATHYCAQGNQPRLTLQRASGGAYDFAFLDATNLASPQASHLTRLRLEFLDADHLVKTEVYEENGKEDVTVLRFTRAR